MGGAALDRLSGLFERHFLTTTFLPTLVFWALVVTVVLTNTGDLAVTIRALGDQPISLAVVEALGFLVWVVFSSIVLGSLQFALLQLFEGYWSFPLGDWLAERGRRSHRAQLVALAGSGEVGYARIYSSYPPAEALDKVMATRLGNILRSMELYPLFRYGLDAVIFWPRLYVLLPDAIAQGIAESRAALDGAVLMATLGAVFAVGMGTYTALTGGAWWLFAAVAGGGTLVALLAYQAALDNAVAYAEQIRVSFDLYRTEVPKQMRLALPATIAEEDAYWTELGLLLYRSGVEHHDWAMWTYDAEPSDQLPRPAATRPPGRRPMPSIWHRVRSLIAGESGTDPPAGPAMTLAPVLEPAGPTPSTEGGWRWGRTLFFLALISLVGVSAALLAVDRQAQAPVPVPVRALSAYRTIGGDDLGAVPLGPREVPLNVARSAAELTGRYLLEPVSAGTPVPLDRVGPAVGQAALSNTVAVAIPITSALALGDTLRPGERVDLTVVPAPRDGQVRSPVNFTDVLVLNVRRGPLTGQPDGRTPTPARSPETSTLILAIPADKMGEFAAASAGATFLLTRAL